MRVRIAPISIFLTGMFAAQFAFAQASIGTVSTSQATVSGLVSVSAGTARLENNATITAGRDTAKVQLARGGAVDICSGSTVHLSQTTVAVPRPPLMIALDRGATEVRMQAGKTDVLLTPDMRFELSDAAALDLRIRVVANGDTCVDNAGKDAPILHVTSPYDDSAYLIRAGQRVLFEHGSLREVVDNESSSCGCPRHADEPGVAPKIPQTQAARENPFPAAVSEGLQQPAVPQAPAGQEHVQVSTALNYSGETNTASGPPPPAVPASSSQPRAVSPSQIPPPLTAPAAPVQASGNKAHNPFVSIGHFFKRLFGGS